MTEFADKLRQATADKGDLDMMLSTLLARQEKERKEVAFVGSNILHLFREEWENYYIPFGNPLSSALDDVPKLRKDLVPYGKGGQGEYFNLVLFHTPRTHLYEISHEDCVFQQARIDFVGFIDTYHHITDPLTARTVRVVCRYGFTRYLGDRISDLIKKYTNVRPSDEQSKAAAKLIREAIAVLNSSRK